MGTRHSRSLLLTCTALALVGLATDVTAQQATTQQAAGQQAASDQNLKPIVLKGKRVKAGDPAAANPLASSTTADDIAKKDITSLQDLGNTTEPGVDYIATKPGQQGGLFIRGLGGPRVVTMVDNIPIPYFENYAREGTGTTSLESTSSAFDFSALSSADVIRGADSSRIGSGALGGALSLHTLEPEDLIGPDKNWGGIAKATYDSEDKSVGGSVAVAKKIQNTSVLFQGSYKYGHERDNKGDNSSFGSARTEPNPADVKQDNVMFKLRQDLEGGNRIGITAERYLSKTDTDMKTLWGTYMPYEFHANDNQERDRVSLDYNYESTSDDSLIDRANVSLYWQRLGQESRSGDEKADGSTYIRKDTMQENSYGIVGGAESNFKSGNLDHTIRFGGAGSLNYFNEYLYANTAGVDSASQSDMPDVTGKQLGLYAEDEISFGNSGFKLTPGIRFDAYDYDPDGSVSSNSGYETFGLPKGSNGSRFSPKLLATYDLTPEVQLFAQWSMAYRAPTMNEMYLNFSNVGYGYAVVGNPDLKAETSNGFEAGASYQSGDLSGKLTVFYNKYKNFIEQQTETTDIYPGYGGFGDGTLFIYRNIPNVKITGVEAKMRKDFANGFFGTASLAYAYGVDTDTNELVRTVAPFKSVVSFGYANDTWGSELTGILAAGMRDDHDASTFDAPGYGIANLTGWWEPTQTKGLRIQAGIYNIFDKKYWNAVGVRNVNPSGVSSSGTNQPTDYYSEPGRYFKISLTQKF
ncbi:TonB-dependent hemoglobin/transferrin/lactoferrin family receptor [Neorhizobium sp. NCHU2750]|uniref:TonB-dependent hemoglobin/transferrin/lactoferrin family receptor n=1 Tax=Neorhizobium sp. NCHU2750 TaxID=1825976 RepID=UPI000E723FD2|nr:heme receptor [Neorhizobium sp. NCHU2750]